MQLSSSPSESDARAAANRLAGRFSGALGGRAPRVVKGEAGGKTVYRVRVGGMSKEGAAASCGDVKAAGGNCFVTRD
ncbi:MAG: SPOR domain-containing protein [Rhodoblastus sp.]|nr:MAG: SPOR domain-containing protein [Rhodoblastus sp.]